VRWLVALLFVPAVALAEVHVPGVVSSAPVPEFYGYGAGATGCAAGVAGCSGYAITSTADSGAGTVRDFFTTGNRYVSSCTVSGTVDLSVGSNLTVTVSNWTLDLGECPDKGLQITGRPLRLGTDNAPADNWIIRHLRSRLGDGGVAESCEIRNANHWAITHSSCQLGGDDSLDVSAQGNTRYVTNGTIQYSIIGPTLGCLNVALGCHQDGDTVPHNQPMLIVGNVGDITLYRNLLMGGDDGRCPRFAPGGIANILPPEEQTPPTGTGRLQLIENWQMGCKYVSISWPDQQWLMIAEYLRNYVQESTTQVVAGEPLVDRPFNLEEDNMDGGSVQIYADGNMVDGVLPADPCDLLSWDGGTQSGAGGPLCEDRPAYMSAVRLSTIRLPTTSARDVPAMLTALVGATKPCRDPFDTTVLAAANSGAGIWIVDGLAEVGGLPDLTDPCGS
jgi:hypothetical protein